MTQTGEVHDREARAEAAALLAAGDVIVIPFNGIYVLAGDADNPAVAEKIALAKNRPQAKGVALVCPPEFLAEHVATDTSTRARKLERAQRLHRSVHALGVILPAAIPGAPTHVCQAGTILNVWTEQHPSSPLRELILDLRSRGRRALAGTSANETGKPTITDADEVKRIFGRRVRMILLDDFASVPATRRRSASIIDLTGETPMLTREGSVTADELWLKFAELNLGTLRIASQLRRV